MVNRFQSRRHLIMACQIMYKQGYLSSMDGNVSIRLDQKTVLTTPTARNKGWLSEDDLVICDMEGQSLESDKRPSTELQMHLQVYKQRSDVNAVVHCHPIFATVYAASSKNLDGCYLTESIVAMGSVPKAVLALPGTKQLADSIVSLIDDNDAILLANHGALAYGTNLEAAVSRMEAVEHFAKLSYYLELADIQNEPKAEVIKQLEELRPQYGFDERFTPCKRSTDITHKANRETIEYIAKQVLDSLKKS